MNSSFAIQQCEKTGRSLYATRNFDKDEILFEEKPVISGQFSWNKYYSYLACDNCMRPLETAEENVRRLTGKSNIVLPYPECSLVNKSNHVFCQHCNKEEYCCQECCDEAWLTFHSVLCPGQLTAEHSKLDLLEEGWKNIHFPPETASIIMLARMIASVKAAKINIGDDGMDNLKGKYSKFCKSTVNEEDDISHKLLGEQYHDNLQVLRELTKDALYDLEVDDWFTPNGFKSLFALIGTNVQGVGTSSFSEWIKNVEKLTLSEPERNDFDNLIDKLYEDIDKEAGQFLDIEGTGLYDLHSTINHSCDPNAEVTFPYNNHIIGVRALKDIKSGDEINISYLDECFLERSRHSRQKELRGYYLFNCVCPKCINQADDPDETSDEEMSESDEEMESG